jgi:hypothetical protein
MIVKLWYYQIERSTRGLTCTLNLFEPINEDVLDPIRISGKQIAVWKKI